MTNAGPPAQLETPTKPKRRRGRATKYEVYMRVAEVVQRIAPDGDWPDKLDEICKALDEGKVDSPKWRDTDCRRWSGCVEEELVVKAVDYRLKVAARHKKPRALRPIDRHHRHGTKARPPVSSDVFLILCKLRFSLGQLQSLRSWPSP